MTRTPEPPLGRTGNVIVAAIITVPVAVILVIGMVLLAINGLWLPFGIIAAVGVYLAVAIPVARRERRRSSQTR